MNPFAQFLSILFLIILLTIQGCKKCDHPPIYIGPVYLYQSSKDFIQIDSSKTYIFKTIATNAELALNIDKTTYLDSVILYLCPIRCLCAPDRELRLVSETISYSYTTVDTVYVPSLNRYLPKKFSKAYLKFLVAPNSNERDTFNILTDILEAYIDSTYFRGYFCLSNRGNVDYQSFEYEIIADTTIAGKQFFNLINLSLYDSNPLYYSVTEGIVYFKDNNLKEWVLDRIE